MAVIIKQAKRFHDWRTILWCTIKLWLTALTISNFFTTQRHASAVYAVVMCLSVCLSFTSRCSTETAKRRITQTMPHDSRGTLDFWCRRSRQNPNVVTPVTVEVPNAGGVVKIGDFRQITCCNSKSSTVASIINLVQSQVYHTERPPLFAARLPWCSASRGFVSDCWYLFKFSESRRV